MIRNYIYRAGNDDDDDEGGRERVVNERVRASFKGETLEREQRDLT